MGEIAATEVETTSCLLCGEAACTPLMQTKDRLCHLPGSFRLVRCDACGLVYLSPRPTRESMDFYYPKAYDPFLTTSFRDLPLIERLGVRYGLHKRCRLVSSLLQGGRLLDVGCATGRFLAAMRQIPGWEVMGVEPSPSAAEFARAACGLEVHVGDLPSARFPDAYFDIVTMWDVLEHLAAPLETLREVRRVLKSDGYLVIRTPSLDSLDARVFGPFWAGLDSPRHLAIFSRRTVTRLLERSGFALRRLRTGGGSYYHCQLSFRHWLEATVAGARLRRMLQVLAGWPARLALALPLALTDALGLGSEMLVVALPASDRGWPPVARDDRLL
jgi:SAM-dependent methyltransferase